MNGEPVISSRFTGTAEGLFEIMWDGENGQFEWEYSVTESGKVENIALPDECTEENLGNEDLKRFR